jgi:hypothetical protein
MTEGENSGKATCSEEDADTACHFIYNSYRICYNITSSMNKVVVVVVVGNLLKKNHCESERVCQ